MFGGHDKVFAIDGYINPDGNLWLIFAYPTRHLVTIGKGKNPIKTIAVDVKGDKAIDLGVIQLAGICPNE